VNGVLRAELDTSIALGAHFGLLVEAFLGAGVQHHKVVGANVDAQGSFMNSLASVASVRINVCRHGPSCEKLLIIENPRFG
jgi:hypothetical protein